MTSILDEAHNDPPVPMGPQQWACKRCGRVGHIAKFCRYGGAWHYDSAGIMRRTGGRPRCFVCCRNMLHNSSNCPYRNPESKMRK